MDMNFWMPGIMKETSNGILRCSIQDEMFQRREIECVGEITQESVYSMILQLRYLEKTEPEEEITMFINSPGGEVSSGLALYDVMQAVKCPVRTVCVGLAASMGALLFACGDKRDMLPHARVMIHDPLMTGGMGGSALKVDNLSRELMKMRTVTCEILAKHTGKSLEEIYSKTATDSYFNAKEAFVRFCRQYHTGIVRCIMEATYRILAEECLACNDTWQTGRNNNDIIIGPSGAGKTRGYVLPNILQCNESIIVSDSKSSLRKKTEKILRQEGYKVVNIDFTDCHASDGYNPFDYIRYDAERDKYSEQDIMTVAACLVPVKSRTDPFWEQAARMYLECLIAYVLECLPEEEHTPCSVVALFREMEGPRFRRLFYELGELNPDSFAFTRYEMFKSTAQSEKTYASILAILAEKLSVLIFGGTKEMFEKPDRIRIEDIGREKTAVFVGVSDTDRSFDRLASLFFAQALHILCVSADKNYPDQRLSVPVRLIMDDFASNVSVPDFDKIISVVRSRDIYVSIILQSISQLESIYEHAKAMTIINNFDTCLYLGGQDVETARYIGIKANKTASTVLEIPLESAWLFQRGTKPRTVRKYRLESHARYAELE